MKMLDNRPKIVSFSSSVHGLEIAASMNILWPCHAYSITIPTKKESDLNIFEELILQLSEIESCTTSHLADITCLEEALVVFIQNRLFQIGYIDSCHELSKSGKDMLSRKKNHSLTELEFTAATVFIDLITGQLLPFVNTKPLIFKNIYSMRTPYVKFLVTPLSDTPITARQIYFDAHSKFNNIIPKPDEIILAMREFSHNIKRYAFLSQNTDARLPYIPMAEAISIQDNPELVYVHCKLYMQKENPEILVTDGFGLGFSESFGKYLSSIDEEWIIRFKERGLIDQLTQREEDGSSLVKAQLEPVSKYPMVEPKLSEAQKKYSIAKTTTIKSEYSKQKKKQLTGNAFVLLYEALEWTFRYVVFKYPNEEWQQVFGSTDSTANDLLLSSFATKIGFDVTLDTKGLLKVNRGKIMALNKGVVEFQPLLALAIAGAIQDSNHPMHSLASAYPQVLKFFKSLKSIRDAVNHGNSREEDLTIEILEKTLTKSERIIHLLLPDVRYNQNRENTLEESDFNQIQQKARITLDKKLGTNFMRIIGAPLQEELMKLAMLDSEKNYDQEVYKKYIILLASSMQLFLFEVAKTHTHANPTERNLLEQAFKAIVISGFYPSVPTIPKEIRTVASHRLERAAFYASSTTLGAALLTIFLVKSEDELKQLNFMEHTFIDLIAELIQERGHGNLVKEMRTRIEVDVLKDRVFGAIKVLQEIFT